MYEPPWYGTVCPVVWEDGGGNPASYPMQKTETANSADPIHSLSAAGAQQ